MKDRYMIKENNNDKCPSNDFVFHIFTLYS